VSEKRQYVGKGGGESAMKAGLASIFHGLFKPVQQKKTLPLSGTFNFVV